ncbi:MAG TPA: hypothetical protein VNY73_00970 [Bacteroidia bacterium]|jgi:hypothetical protein|nr:hypothetical protein [Bacteroidia bacterium]
MKPLTIEHAIENKFNNLGLVKYFNPSWSDEECDHYLWEHTCFPFSIEETIKQLNKAFLI